MPLEWFNGEISDCFDLFVHTLSYAREPSTQRSIWQSHSIKKVTAIMPGIETQSAQTLCPFMQNAIPMHRTQRLLVVKDEEANSVATGQGGC